MRVAFEPTVLRPRVRVIVVGRFGDRHFRAALDVLACEADCEFVARDELQAVAGSPTLVVLLQSWPGEYSQVLVDGLRRKWPLVCVVSIAGNWCEGEPRSGRPLTGVYRTTWEMAALRFANELPKLNAGRGGFALPATTTQEERTSVFRAPTFEQRYCVAVAARRLSAAAPIVEAMGAAGAASYYWSLESPPVARGIDAVVWDTAGCEQALDLYAARLPAECAARIAMCDFPRPQDVKLLSSLGIGAVLGKPLMTDDIAAWIESVAGERQASPRRASLRDASEAA